MVPLLPPSGISEKNNELLLRDKHMKRKKEKSSFYSYPLVLTFVLLLLCVG